MLTSRTGTVAALGSAQTLARASTYYLPAIVAAPLARDLGLPVPAVFAAFPLALVGSAVLGPHAGRPLTLGVRNPLSYLPPRRWSTPR